MTITEQPAHAAAQESTAGQCPDCTAAVWVMPTSRGRVVTLDAQPHPEGQFVLRRPSGERPHVQVLAREAIARLTSRPTWQPHVITCPAQTSQWHTEVPGSLVLSGLLCPGCPNPLPVRLLAIGMDIHPTCSAPPQRDVAPAPLQAQPVLL